jgi:hypothetical protein
LISEDNEEDDEQEKKLYQIQYNKKILIHSYINLFYCLSLKKNYMEILLYIQNLKNFLKKNYNNNKNYEEIKEINNIIFHYEIEAKFYIYKNNKNNNNNINNLIKELEDKINNDDNNNNNIESKFYINKNKEIKYKFILLYRLCIMYIKNKNYSNAENAIKSMFNIINNNSNNNNIELPTEYINIIIYFNLMKLNDKDFMKDNYDKENKIKNNIINMIKYKKNIIFNNNNNINYYL